MKIKNYSIKFILFNPIFIGSAFLLILHQFVQKVWLINLPFIDAYLDDFLAMPFILSLFWIEQLFWKRRTTNLSTFEIIIFTVLFAVFFEEIIPKFSINYTKDYWDYLMYGLGSLVFYFTINRIDFENRHGF
ncbi:MAG: hypothetical protein ACJAUH_001196 [Saprospiraceae bacterium]